ncbi:MAG: hypothetical protein M3125_08060 [Gemmatimonadota bacterium]|nr:hypothetical protein [Gemmatimonadota bacterium]
MVDELLPFAFAFASLIVGARIVLPLVSAWAKRLENRADSGRVPPDVASRLERMEQAIDSIAVEVERISESQRFAAKLLSDKTRSYSEHAE